MSVRIRLLEAVALLASRSEQRQYGVVGEIFCSMDDAYHPKSPEFLESFSESELKGIAHLYGLVCEAARGQPQSVHELQQDQHWQRVVALAKELHVDLSRAL